MRLSKLFATFTASMLLACCVMTPAFAADDESSASFEASIGGNSFATLQAAFASADEGTVVTLQDDVVLTDTLRVSKKAFTLDLNGHNIDGSSCSGNLFYLQDSNIEVRNSASAGGEITGPVVKVDISSFGEHSTVCLKDESWLVLKSGVTLKGAEISAQAQGVELQGGAVYATEGSVVLLDGASITENKLVPGVSGRAYGAGVYLDEESVLIANSGSISGNIIETSASETKSGGAGVCLKDSCRASLYDAVISGNQIHVANSGSGAGAGIYMGIGSKLESFSGSITQNEIIATAENSANCFGAGVYSESNIGDVTGTMLFYGGEVAENKTPGSGGGVYANAGTRVSVLGSTVVRDNSAVYGAGLYVSGNNSLLYLAGDARIVDNTASGSGGGIFLNAESKLIQQSGYIGQNKSLSTSSQGGAGICANLSTVWLKGGVVTENVSNNDGGGLFLSRAVLQIEDGAAVTENRSGWHGGGIAADSSSTLNLVGGKISDNQVGVMEREHDGYYGGGVAILDSFSTLNLSGSVIQGNSALDEDSAAQKYGYGGGIYSAMAPLTLKEGYILENEAGRGGGIFADSVSLLHLTNPYIAHNAASCAGGAIALGQAGRLILDTPTVLPFYKNSAGQFGDTLSIVYQTQAPSLYNFVRSKAPAFSTQAWMLDGFTTNDEDAWGIVQPGSREDNNREYGVEELTALSGGRGLKMADASDTMATRAASLAKLHITGNQAVYGGAIAATGTVEIMGLQASLMQRME